MKGNTLLEDGQPRFEMFFFNKKWFYSERRIDSTFYETIIYYYYKELYETKILYEKDKETASFPQINESLSSILMSAAKFGVKKS